MVAIQPCHLVGLKADHIIVCIFQHVFSLRNNPEVVGDNRLIGGARDRVMVHRDSNGVEEDLQDGSDPILRHKSPIVRDEN